jgi:hypothetical protein
MKEDKIFNNSFNRGDIEYELFGEIKVVQEATGDLYEDYIETKLQEDLYKIYKESPYSGDFEKTRKNSKSVLAEIYYYFDDRLKSDDMSAVERFTAIAEFMTAPYDTLFNELGSAYQDRIIRELDGKYKIFAKKNIKRLF